MTNRRTEQRRVDDRKRRAEQPWRKWYYTKTWKIRRQRQLAREPFCCRCKSIGRTRIATVANHKIPHRGDRKLFFGGELESVCKPCHDRVVQQEELSGFERSIDAAGWPTDPKHPFNRARIPGAG